MVPSHDIINIAVPSLIVVKVGVDGIGDNHQFFVSDGHALAVWILARHLFEGVLREVAAGRIREPSPDSITIRSFHDFLYY